jgi:ABC-type glutathione transport system ATPase component
MQAAILRVLPKDARTSGSIRFDGEELLSASERHMRTIRGRRIAVVLQAARAALTPTLRAGTWIDRALALHGVPRAERAARLQHALAAVRLDGRLLERYPHELSGGEAQRVSIALAVALRADLVLADEATSALDVTVQAEVAELFRELRESEGTSFLMVSHDLALVAGLADRISIIAAGRIVERGGPEVLERPADPVTRALVEAKPSLPRAAEGGT